jgi:hypothetical protein
MSLLLLVLRFEDNYSGEFFFNTILCLGFLPSTGDDFNIGVSGWGI